MEYRFRYTKRCMICLIVYQRVLGITVIPLLLIPSSVYSLPAVLMHLPSLMLYSSFLNLLAFYLWFAPLSLLICTSHQSVNFCFFIPPLNPSSSLFPSLFDLSSSPVFNSSFPAGPIFFISNFPFGFHTTLLLFLLFSAHPSLFPPISHFFQFSINDLHPSLYYQLFTKQPVCLCINTDSCSLVFWLIL